LTRFGVINTLTPVSVISAFVAVIGETTVGLSQLSMRMVNVTDTLCPERGVYGTYYVSNVTLLSGGTAHTVQYENNIPFGLLDANALGVITTVDNVRILTNLPVDTLFDTVRVNLTNQFGVSATLDMSLNPVKYTLDASSPQVVGNVSVQGNGFDWSVDVSMNTYDSGVSTTTYTGVVFASSLSSYDLSAITSSTPNTQSFVGDGKTALAMDNNAFNLTIDINGAPMTSGSYYVYYVLYDPNNNRTTNQNGPVLSVTLTPLIPTYSNNTKSMNFESSKSQYGSVAWNPIISGSINTISMWVYVRNPGNSVTTTYWLMGWDVADTQIFVRRSTNTSWDHTLHTYLRDTNSNGFSFYNLPGLNQWWDKWHHLVVEMNTSIGKYPLAWMDGVLLTPREESFARTNISVESGTTTYVGTNRSLNSYMNGYIDEIAMFTGVFTQAQVTESYNTGLPLDMSTHSKSSQLTAYWKMEDTYGNGNQVLDQTGNNRHLSFVSTGTMPAQLEENAVPTFVAKTVGSFTPMTWITGIRRYELNADKSILISFDVSNSFLYLRAFDTTNYAPLWSFNTNITGYQFETCKIINNTLVLVYTLSSNTANVYFHRYMFTTSSCTLQSSVTKNLGRYCTRSHIAILDSTGKYVISVANQFTNGTVGSYYAYRFYPDGTEYGSVLTWSNFIAQYATEYWIAPIQGTGSGWDFIGTTVDQLNSFTKTLYYVFDATNTSVFTATINTSIYSDKTATTAGLSYRYLNNSNIVLTAGYGNLTFEVYINTYSGAVYSSSGARMKVFYENPNPAYRDGFLTINELGTSSGSESTVVQYVNSENQRISYKLPYNISYTLNQPGYLLPIIPGYKYLTIMPGTLTTGDQTHKFVEIETVPDTNTNLGSLLQITGIAACYGLRRIVPSYTGPMIDVKKGAAGETASVYIDSSRNVERIVVNGVSTVGATAFRTWAGATAESSLWVTCIYDQTGGGKHFDTLGVASFYPTVDKYLSYVSFVYSSTSYRGLRSSTGGVLAGQDQYTYGMCWKSGADVTGTKFVFVQRPTVENSVSQYGQRSGFRIQNSNVCFSGYIYDNISVAPLAVNTFYRSVLTIDDTVTENNIKLTNNNKVYATFTKNTVASNVKITGSLNLTPTTMNLGCGVSGSGTSLEDPFNGYFYELIIYSGKTTPQQNEAMSRLWTRYYS
jgi:hypothetical protein